jgi:hypothetical protein
MTQNAKYSIPNQPQRFANAKAEGNKRYLDIDSVYNPAYLKGKTVLVTGNNIYQSFNCQLTGILQVETVVWVWKSLKYIISPPNNL